MDRLEAMTILLRVVEKGSFSAASRELGMPLATVSRKVNELETHLGTRLLVRTTRKVALTDTGADVCGFGQTHSRGDRRDRAGRRRRVPCAPWRADPDGAGLLRPSAHPPRRHRLPCSLSGDQCPTAAVGPEPSLDRRSRRYGGADRSRCRTAAWWPRASARCGRSCAPVQSCSRGTAFPNLQRIWPHCLASISTSFRRPRPGRSG